MEKNSVEFDINSLIGLKLDDAKQLAEGFNIRIMRDNGVNLFGTSDLKFNRINLHLLDGIVLTAYFG